MSTDLGQSIVRAFYKDDQEAMRKATAPASAVSALEGTEKRLARMEGEINNIITSVVRMGRRGEELPPEDCVRLEATRLLLGQSEALLNDVRENLPS